MITLDKKYSRSGTGRVVPENKSSSASSSGTGDDGGINHFFIRPRWTVISVGMPLVTRCIDDRRYLRWYGTVRYTVHAKG